MSTAAAPRRYFCHQCDRTVSITPSPSGDLSCPLCSGGFLEEFDLPTPTPNPNPNFSPFDALFAAATAGHATGPTFTTGPSFVFSPASGRFDMTNFLGPDPFRTPSPDSAHPHADAEPFNPLQFFQTYMNNLVAGGANVQFVFEGGPGGPAASPFSGANLGDYFVGPGLEQLIQQLAENDPNRYGTPPAAKSVVDSLPDVKITDELLASDEAQCAVCKDEFESGETAKQIPCKHIYHKDCIVPWLELHNSCPVCRYELPTDDQEYEQRKGPSGPSVETGGERRDVVMEAADASGPATPGGNAMTVERRFRISLPWPFSGLGSAESSGAGDGSNNGNNQGGHRQGDLD